MKAILILVFAALVLHAGIRMGDSIWRNMQFEDALEQEARLGDQKTTSALRARVVEIAGEQGVEIDESDVTVETIGREVAISLEYAEILPLVPSVYAHEQVYDVTIRLQPLRPLVDDQK